MPLSETPGVVEVEILMSTSLYSLGLITLPFFLSLVLLTPEVRLPVPALQNCREERKKDVYFAGVE